MNCCSLLFKTRSIQNSLTDRADVVAEVVANWIHFKCCTLFAPIPGSSARLAANYATQKQRRFVSERIITDEIQLF